MWSRRHLHVSGRSVRVRGATVGPLSCRHLRASSRRLPTPSPADGRVESATLSRQGCRQRSSSPKEPVKCLRASGHLESPHTQGPVRPCGCSADQHNRVRPAPRWGTSIRWGMFGALLLLLLAGVAYFAAESLEPERPIASSMMVITLGFFALALVRSAICGRRLERLLA